MVPSLTVTEDYSSVYSLEAALLLTATVLLAQVRKPPDIAQTNAVPDNTEKELHLAAPFRPVVLLRLLLVTGGILTWRRYDCYVMSGLAVVVQGSELVPIPRCLALDYHPPVSKNTRGIDHPAPVASS